jgi:hypothetical protein
MRKSFLISLLFASFISNSVLATTCPEPNLINNKKVEGGYIFTAEGGWTSKVINWTGEIGSLVRAAFTPNKPGIKELGTLNFCAYRFKNTSYTVTLKLPVSKNRASIPENANYWYPINKDKIYACHGGGSVENCPFTLIDG